MTIQKLTSASAVASAMREFDKLSRSYFLEKYGYGKSREYMILDRQLTGKLYDTMAIFGVAYGFEFPDHGPLSPDEFPDSEQVVAELLTELGFEVVRTGQEWSREEVENAVADYFDMLSLEAKRERYSKSEHNETLRAKLPARSKASIELKHQNISAVLDSLGLPFIPGYKPRGNLQTLLRTVVQEHLERSGPIVSKILDDFDSQIEPGAQQYVGVIIDTPKPERILTPRKLPRLPRKFDFAQREEANRKLGYGGESWTVGYEKFRLNEANRPDLASKIDWISDRLGDGAGYDILSFEYNDVTRFIEVKTTNGGSTTPFIVTQNELEFSEEMGDAFWLYRLFDFSKTPGLFLLRGDIRQNVDLEPTNYRARLKALVQ